MNDITRAQEIAAELSKSARLRSMGKIAIAVASTILNAIPIGGGSIARMVDEIGDRVFDAALEPKFKELCELVTKIEPKLGEIENLKDAISSVAQTIQRNESILQRVLTFTEHTYPAVKTFLAKNIGSKQDFINTTITNMKVAFETYDRGVTTLDRVQTFGEDVTFQTSGGGSQVVQNSGFHGDIGGIQIITTPGSRMVIQTSPGARIVFSPGRTNR